MGTGHSWRLGRVAGVEIRIDASWLVMFVLVTYSLFLRFTLTYPNLVGAAAIALALSATGLFFASVLAHELSHAAVARRVGIAVRGITLFIFGGATHADVESRGPRDELVVSAAGPLSSLAIAAVLWGLSAALGGLVPSPVEGALGYLGWINVLLGLFNLLPGFPLDGGRIFRSIVWGATHSLRRATRVASVVGEGLGYVMVAAGFFLLFGGLLVSGIWLAAIGWFLAQAARSSWRDVEVRELVRGARVEQVMEEPLSLWPDLPLDEAAERYLLRSDQPVFPIEDRGRTVGVLTPASVRSVPRERWRQVSVGSVMRSLSEEPVVAPHTPVGDVLDRLRASEDGFVIVAAGDRVTGIVTATDVGAWLRRHEALVA